MPPLYAPGMYAPSAPPAPGSFYNGYGGGGMAVAGGVAGAAALQDAFKSLSLDQVRCTFAGSFFLLVLVSHDFCASRSVYFSYFLWFSRSVFSS